MSTPISVQLFSIRDDCSRDLEGTLTQLKEFGYDGVEPYSLHGYTAKEFKDILDRVGLKCTSFHTGLEVYLNEGIEKTCEERILLGCEVVAFPYLIGGYRPGEEHYQTALEYFEKIAAIYGAEGIDLLFHNHEGDAYPLTAESKKGMMFNLFDETPIKPEADTAWLLAAGIDPVEFFKQYETPAIHIKDFSYIGRVPERVIKAVGRACPWKDDDDSPSEFQFRTLGQGLHDIPRTVLAAIETGKCRHIIVEQDNPTPGKTAIECAKMNVEFLRTFIK